MLANLARPIGGCGLWASPDVGRNRQTKFEVFLWIGQGVISSSAIHLIMKRLNRCWGCPMKNLETISKPSLRERPKITGTIIPCYWDQVIPQSVIPKVLGVSFSKTAWSCRDGTVRLASQITAPRDASMHRRTPNASGDTTSTGGSWVANRRFRSIAGLLQHPSPNRRPCASPGEEMVRCLFIIFVACGRGHGKVELERGQKETVETLVEECES